VPAGKERRGPGQQRRSWRFWGVLRSPPIQLPAPPSAPQIALFAFAGWAGPDGNGIISGLGLCGIVLTICSVAAMMVQVRLGHCCASQGLPAQPAQRGCAPALEQP
jgi:hypothetical protein